MPSLQAISRLISQYGYAFLLPAAIIEGPIVTIIGAFLASLGTLNIYWVYGIAVLGDVIGDAIYYWIGRAGRRTIIPKYGRYVGITEERIRATEKHYSNHLLKTLIFGKITQAPVLAIIVTAGVTKTNFWKFIGLIILITIPKALIFTLIGYFLGKSFPLISHYLNSYFVIMWVVLIVGVVLYWWFKRRSSQS